MRNMKPFSSVTKHRAPKGALRPIWNGTLPAAVAWLVTKHRAPKGALRLDPTDDGTLTGTARHKAPSAKRCIKTPDFHARGQLPESWSQSTERQKVH